jgi:hypothetical protein
MATRNSSAHYTVASVSVETLGVHLQASHRRSPRPVFDLFRMFSALRSPKPRCQRQAFWCPEAHPRFIRNIGSASGCSASSYRRHLSWHPKDRLRFIRIRREERRRFDGVVSHDIARLVFALFRSLCRRRDISSRDARHRSTSVGSYGVRMLVVTLFRVSCRRRDDRCSNIRHRSTSVGSYGVRMLVVTLFRVSCRRRDDRCSNIRRRFSRAASPLSRADHVWREIKTFSKQTFLEKKTINFELWTEISGRQYLKNTTAFII